MLFLQLADLLGRWSWRRKGTVAWKACIGSWGPCLAAGSVVKVARWQPRCLGSGPQLREPLGKASVWRKVPTSRVGSSALQGPLLLLSQRIQPRFKLSAFFYSLWVLFGNFFFLRIFFFMWTSFKGFIEFVTILLMFYVFGFFGHEACRILTPWPGLQPASPALEGEVLPTDLQGGPLLGKLRLVFRMWHISTMLLLQHMTPNFCIWLLDYSWAMWSHCVETCSLLWEGAARLGLQTLEQSWVTPSLPWPGSCSDSLPASIAQWLWWGSEGAERWTRF